MALMSVSSSTLSFCLKSKPTHLTNPSPKSFHSLGRKSLRNPIMNKAMATTRVENVTRRTENHHGNLWDDDFIQSLPKLPYDAPEYRERADQLVGEVKNVFSAVGATDSSPQNILRRLEIVDKVECLRIGRHFEMEIEDALDYIYRFWIDINKDLNTTTLGLRILQLHRYPVSSELQMISRWWKDSSLYKLDFSRHRHIEYLFQGCAITGEPKHSSFRIEFAKYCSLGTIIDDIYDTYGSIEELKYFTEVFKRWDSSPPDYLPEYMKIAYSTLYDDINKSA